MTAKLRFKRRRGLGLERLNILYEMRHWDSRSGYYSRDGKLRNLVLKDGVLYLDDLPVFEPVFDHIGIRWTQATASTYTSGNLVFSADRLSYSGTIFRGADVKTAERYEVSGSIPPTLYHTQVSVDPGGKISEEGLLFMLGFEHDKDTMPQSIRRLGKGDSMFDITSFSTMYVNEKTNNLVVEISCGESIAGSGFTQFGEVWPAQAKFELSWDARNIDGDMTKTKDASGEATQERFRWCGVCDDVSLRLSASVGAVGITASDRLTDSDLNVVDLAGISPDGVSDLAMDMLLENMKWAMNDEWRSNFFGEAKPLLDKKRIAMIEPNKTFYTDTFTPAYLGWGFANMDPKAPGAPRTTLTDAQKNKLKYFLHQGLAKDPAYNLQSNQLYLEAFIESSGRRLRRYMEDATHHWAQELFDAITTHPQLISMANRIICTHDMSLANRYTTLLNALDASGDLAKRYYSAVVIQLMMRMSENYTMADPKQSMEWLPDFIANFISKYIEKPLNPTREELVRWQAAQELEAAAEMAGGFAKLAMILANLFAGTKGGDLYSQTYAHQQEWIRQHPKYAKACSIFRVMGLTGGIYSAIVGFQDWEQLEGQSLKKTEIIVSMVELAGDLILAIPDILSIAPLSLDVLIRVRNFFASIGRLLRINSRLLTTFGNWMNNAAQRIRTCFNRATRAITDETRYIGRIFQKFAEVMTYLGAAVTAAFAVFATIDFISDIVAGKPVLDLVFEGILAASALFEAAFLVIGLFVTSALVTACTAIFAVLGVVAALVSLFVPRPQPESPVESFMKTTLIPFVDKQKTPPPEWVAPTAVQHALAMA